MSQIYAPGRYRGRMIRASIGKSAKKETCQLTFEFEPIGKYGPGETLEACASDDRAIFKFITPNTVDYVVANLHALGYDRETFSEIDSNADNAFPWEGIEFDATLKYEEYEGKERERWDFPLKGIGGKPMEDREVRGLDAQFGAALRKPGAAPNPAATRAPVNHAADQAAAAASHANTEAEAADVF